MKSHSIWRLCEVIAISAMFLAYATQLHFIAAISGVFWIIYLWGSYFTERSNFRKFDRLKEQIQRLKKNATKDRLAATGEIEGLQEMLKAEKAKKNIVAGSRVNLDKIRELTKENAAQTGDPNGER